MADLNINDYRGMIGAPINPYQQEYNDTCAIKSQQLILNEFGIQVSEDQLVQYSINNGWYDGNGTAMEDVGKILADAGIPCTQSIDANVYDLANELAQGHKVIVAVDSGELWNNSILDWLKDIFFGETPDHALIVAGIDMSDPNNPMVILTDPGTGQAAQPYPLDQFMDAWGDSHNFMVSTDLPSPSMIESFQQNGLNEMHLDSVAGVDYNTFQEFHEYSHLIESDALPNLNMAFHDFPALPQQDFNMTLEMYGLNMYDSIELTDSYDSMIDSNTLDKLDGYYQDALDHAQDCLDHEDYFGAQLWQNEANETYGDMLNLM